MPDFYSILGKFAFIIVGVMIFLNTRNFYLPNSTPRQQQINQEKHQTTLRISTSHEKQYDKSDLIYENFMGHQKSPRRVAKIDLFDFVIGGVKKCGTAALTNFLSLHPQINFQHLYANEGHYFDIACLGLSNDRCLSLENRRRFNYSPVYKRPNIVYGEATPAYFTNTGMAAKLKKYNPSLKVIIITCDPAKRALSDYRHELQVVGNAPSTRPENTNLMSLFYKNQFDEFETIVSKAVDVLENKLDSEKQAMISEYDYTWQAFWINFQRSTLTQIKSDLSNTAQTLSFSPMLKVVLDGFYNIFMEDYFRHFTYGTDLIVLDNEDLLTDPFKSVRSIESFLQLESFATENMFVKPDNSPFFCTNTSEANSKAMEVRHKIGIQKEIKTKRKRKNDAPFVCKSGKQAAKFTAYSSVKKTYSLVKDNPLKSRSLHTETTAAEYNALDQLQLLYEPSRKKLENMLKRKFNWWD